MQGSATGKVLTGTGAALIAALSVALVYLTLQALDHQQQAKLLRQENVNLAQTLTQLESRHREADAARQFMDAATDFVNKAHKLGIRGGDINRYDIDFSQPVAVSKIPALLAQSRSVDGRYYVPQSLQISREGIARSESLDDWLKHAINQRNRSYKLSFSGNVFVVANGHN